MVALKINIVISTIVGLFHILKLLGLTFIQGHKGTIFRIIKMLIFLEIVELKTIRLAVTIVRYLFYLNDGNLMALTSNQADRSVSNTCKLLDLNCHMSQSTGDIQRLFAEKDARTCERTLCRQ